MRKKFTGGNQFQEKDGLIFYVHHMMMSNELKGGFGAYEISSALNAASGLSFGGIQRDISTNDKNNNAIFETILKNTYDFNGKRIVNDNEIKLIQKHLYKPTKAFTQEDNQVYTRLKYKINQALSSEDGQDMLNQDYTQQLLEKVQKAQHVITNISNYETKLFVEKSLAAQMIIVDTFNQFSPAVRIAFTNLLNAQANAKISIPYSKPERFFNVPEHVNIQTLIDFKLSLNYGRTHPQDTMRRINNIQNIVAKYADVTQIIPTIISNIKSNEAVKLQEKSNRTYDKYTQKFETVASNYVVSSKVKNILIHQKKAQQTLQFNDILEIMLPNIANHKVHITSNFGPRPHVKISPNHNGVDFNYEGGQKGINLKHPEVHTPIAGEVIKPLNPINPTNMLRIKDRNGFIHEFLHLNAHAVKIGSIVEKGQIIGYMGNKGVITQQHHVHYQIKEINTNNVIDPAKFWNNKKYAINNNTNIITHITTSANTINKDNDINNWKLTPIDIDKKDMRYQNIYKALNTALTSFATLSLGNQDKIIRQYIQDKNQEYIETHNSNNIKSTNNTNTNTNTNNNSLGSYVLPKVQYNEDEDITKQYTR